MEFTGERMIPEYNEGREIYLEHITRYNFAKQFVKNKIVLDIACGSGYGTDLIARNGASFVYGVDISDESIEYCKKYYKADNINFKVGSVEKIPLDDNSVDVIVSFETLEHVDEITQKHFLSEINRVLRADGILIISTPNASMSSAGNPFHLKELTLSEFEMCLSKIFIDVEIFYQQCIQSNFIFSEGMLKQEAVTLENVDLDKLVKYEKGEAHFFVAVCFKNKPTKHKNKIREMITLFNDAERKELVDLISAKDKIIADYLKYIRELEKNNENKI